MSNTKDTSSGSSEVRRSGEDSQHEIQQFVGQGTAADGSIGDKYETSQNKAPPPVQKVPSVLQRMQTRFFSDKIKEDRRSLFFRTFGIYFLMGFFILSIFSIYWGSFYQRNSRLKNLRMLVVIEDNETINGTRPLIGDALDELLHTPYVEALGSWEIQNVTEFNELAESHGNTIYEEVERQIHHQNYWAALYVKPNATLNYKNAILEGNTSYNLSANSIICYYETGRDINGMNSYVTPSLEKINTKYVGMNSNITSELIADSDASELFSNLDSLKVATTAIEFLFVDARPFTDPVLVAPSQVGLIYMIIVTFFTFNFFAEVHKSVQQLGIKKPHLLIYRVCASVLSFFFMSLFFSFVSLAFQVDFTVAYGKSGFLVYWMTNFLTMWAVGAMNEAMAMFCILVYPPLVGFWMLFWVVSNISATFSPIAVCPEFYRFTYAMPIHAAYEVTKVIVFDTYKGALGRNYAIIIIWVVISTSLMLIAFILFGKVMGKRAMLERRKLEEQVLAKKAKDEEERIVFDN